MEPHPEPNTIHRRIARLPPDLVNQIAAGEVVERPASVVKELVENSLDAGATRIDVLLSEGGLEEIVVVDNGSGMDATDLALSLEPHATSKLRTASDLEAIGTFGFRGEALASIASVSEIEVTSRTAAMTSALSLRADRGKTSGSLKPAGAPVGTRTSVRGLFAHIPGRLKFMRSQGTELSHCTKIVRELALGNPGRAFYLHHQGKLLHKYVAEDAVERMRECLKMEWEPIEVRETGDGISLEAFLSPTHHIEDSGELYLYVNGRIVRNRPLLAALRRAYLDTLGPHHEPSGVAYLKVRADWVDVNVHPQKWEVRIVQQERLFVWLVACLRKALQRHPGPTLDAPRPNVSEPRVEYPPKVEYQAPAWKPAALPMREPTPQPLATPERRTPRLVGQLQSKHLLCEFEGALLVLEPRALQSALAYERLKQATENGVLPAQHLMVPKVLHLSLERHACLEKRRELFTRLGFDIELYGEGDVAVRSYPVGISEPELFKVLNEALDRVSAEGENAAPEQAIRHILVALAEQMVNPLSPYEAQRLVSEIPSDKLDGPARAAWKSPSGRPVVYALTKEDLQKYFQTL